MACIFRWSIKLLRVDWKSCGLTCVRSLAVALVMALAVSDADADGGAAKAQAPTTELAERLGYPCHATLGWQQPGATIKAGDVLTLTSQGYWNSNPRMFGDNSGAGETDSPARPGYVMPGQPEGMLIGRIGNYVFPIGDYARLDPSPASGVLECIINDDLQGIYGNGFKDNRGFVVIDIEYD